MIYLRVHFLFNSAKRKFKWSKIGKIGSKLMGMFGGGGDDDDNGAYPMYKREENEEGQ